MNEALWRGSIRAHFRRTNCEIETLAGSGITLSRGP